MQPRRHQDLISHLLSDRRARRPVAIPSSSPSEGTPYRAVAGASSPDPRGVTLLELRAELCDILAEHPSYGDAELGEHLLRTFGILPPLDEFGRQPSRPFPLRGVGSSTDQLLSLQALVFDWVYTEQNKLFYRTKGDGPVRGGSTGSTGLRVVGVAGPNGQQLLTVSSMRQAMTHTNSQVAFEFKLQIGGQLQPAAPHQNTALKSFLENWWRATGQIAYNNSQGRQLLLVRRYNLQDEDYTRCPYGTGIYCTTTLECIEDPRNVFTHKMADGRVVHYDRASIEAWVRTRRHDPTWPNTGERMDSSVAARILGETPPRPVGPDDIRCCWQGYRVILTRAQVRPYQGSHWQIRLPRRHYSAGFAHRVGDWDWNAAQDIENAPADVRARWERDVVNFGDDHDGDDEPPPPPRRRRVDPSPAPDAPSSSSPDILIYKVAAWSLGEAPSAAAMTTPIAIFTPDAVMAAFHGVLGPILHNKTVHNSYFDTATRIDAAQLTPSHLQALARNEMANVTGVIDDGRFYPGLPADTRFRAVRLLRCLVKCSIVASIVECHHYGGYPAGAPLHARAGQIILIDQSGFQWQRDYFDTGGVFFYPAAPPAHFVEWRQTCYRAFFEQDLPASPATPMEVTWLGRPGHMCEEQLKRGFRLEFVHAFVCASQMARAAGRVAYFRFLKAGLGFFCEDLDPTTKGRLPSLRLQGIAQALEAMNDGDATHVRVLELPFSDGDDPAAMTRIEGACALLGIDFRGGRTVDALAPIEGDAILAVTNCADPHAAIGNEGGHASVDAAIATNTRSKHMVVAARMPQMSSDASNVTYNVLPTIPGETVAITSALAPKIYRAVVSLHGADSPTVATMQSKNNSGGIVGSKMQFALEALGFGDGELRYAHDGYTLSRLPGPLQTTLTELLHRED